MGFQTPSTYLTIIIEYFRTDNKCRQKIESGEKEENKKTFHSCYKKKMAIITVNQPLEVFGMTIPL